MLAFRFSLMRIRSQERAERSGSGQDFSLRNIARRFTIYGLTCFRDCDYQHFQRDGRAKIENAAAAPRFTRS